MAAPDGQGYCSITVINVTAQSPIGLPLTVWFYLNYKNGLNVDDAPIRDAGMQIPTHGLSTDPQTLAPQTFQLPMYLNRLKSNSPNTLWIWVSDGFVGCDSSLASCPPTAIPGRYATSFSWTIDFTKCPNFP
jgi:hypothetical protein